TFATTTGVAVSLADTNAHSGTITINGTSIAYTTGATNSATAVLVASAIHAASATTGVDAVTTGGSNDTLVLTQTAVGAANQIVITGAVAIDTGLSDGTVSNGTDVTGSAALNAAAIVAAINANTS